MSNDKQPVEMAGLLGWLSETVNYYRIAMPQPIPSRRFALVELIKLFTNGKNGHPIWGIIALSVVVLLPLVVGVMLRHFGLWG